MNKEHFLELQSRVEELEEEARTLSSTLEAVHDAMSAEFTNPMTYRDAIYGTSRTAYRMKEELRTLLDLLERCERGETTPMNEERRTGDNDEK